MATKTGIDTITITALNGRSVTGGPDLLERATEVATEAHRTGRPIADVAAKRGRAQDRQPFPFPEARDFEVRVYAKSVGDDEEIDLDEDDDEGRLVVRDFLPAPQLAEIGRRLIRERDEFIALRSCTITWLWRREGGKSQGKATLAKATPAPKLWRHQVTIDATIWLAADYGRAHRLTYRQVEACLYHELLHLTPKEDGSLGTIRHDFEGFLKELEAYGAWKQDLQQVQALVRQMCLPGFDREGDEAPHTVDLEGAPF